MKYRISLSQLKQIIKEEITEAGKRGKYLEEWSKDDQTIAFYLARCGNDLGMSKKQIAEDYIGTSLASLVQQMANFRFLIDQTGGLDRPNKLQSEVFQEFRNVNCEDFKNKVKMILSNYSTDERKVNKHRIGREMGTPREKRKDDIAKALEDLRKSNPEFRNRRLTHIDSRPKSSEPMDPEETPFIEPEQPTIQIEKTSLDDVKDFLSKLTQKIDDVKMSNDISMLDSLKDDIDFIKDYIDDQLSPKLAEQRMRKRLFESRVKKIIQDVIKKR